MNYRTIMSVVLVGGFSTALLPSDVIRTDHAAERFSSKVTAEDLLGLVDSNPHMQHLARLIIEMAYEREPKELMASGNAYGCEFPLYPEQLESYLKSAKGKTVLEIAAGHGEHGLLFTLAGANRVYINDIEPENFSLVKQVMAQLPSEYRNRIHLLPQDCFDLKNKKELHQSCDLIIVRNLIHFFTKEKREQFFKMIALLLKPGGQVLLSVNAPASSGFPRELIERYPDTTLFHRITPVVSTPGLPREPFATGAYLGEYFVGDPLADPLAYTFKPLITFVPTGIEKHAALNQFSPEAQQGIVNQAQQLIEDYGIPYLRKKVITLDCHTGSLIFFTERTLGSVLDTTPFEVMNMVHTNYVGHTTNEQEQATAITAIFTKKVEKACFTCGKTADQKCSRCKASYFCDRDCQVAGWPQHKKECK